MEIRNARLDDLDIIMEMIVRGRQHISEYGIPQWINGYPSVELISEDINTNKAYVLLRDNEIIAYYVVVDFDECYVSIDGKWLDDSDYVAIHRSVTKSFNEGLGTLLFAELKKKYDHIRIDTHEGNISMNKCLLKNGFKYCGIIKLKDGALRNAYEYSK